MTDSAEKAAIQTPEETLGELVLRRVAEGELAGIGICLADTEETGMSVFEALRDGIQIRLLNVTTRRGKQIAHIGISAPQCLRIEREENLTHPRPVSRQEINVDRRLREVPSVVSAGELREWIEEARIRTTELESTIRELKEEVRLARSRGWHHRENDGFMKYTMLQKAIGRGRRDATMLRESTKVAIERLKEANLKASQEWAGDYEHRFYQAAKGVLTEKQLEKVKCAMSTDKLEN